MGHKRQIALVALVLAVFSWYLVTGRERVETWVDIPVEMTNPPKGLIILEGMANTLNIRLRGPKGLVRGVAADVPRYTLDLKSLEAGENVIPFKPENLALSNAIEVMEVRPARINLVVDRQAERMAEVVPQWEGELAEDYRFLSAKARPASVRILGPESKIQEMDEVSTETVSVSEVPPQNLTREVGLVMPEEVEADPPRVQAEFRFGFKRKDLWIKVPLVHETPEGLSALVAEKFVRIHLECPNPFFRREGFREGVVARVELEPGLEPGKHSLPVAVDLPEGCETLKLKPTDVDVLIRE